MNVMAPLAKYECGQLRGCVHNGNNSTLTAGQQRWLSMALFSCAHTATGVLPMTTQQQEHTTYFLGLVEVQEDRERLDDQTAYSLAEHRICMATGKGTRHHRRLVPPSF
jgi:hypothetical protein